MSATPAQSKNSMAQKPKSKLPGTPAWSRNKDGLESSLEWKLGFVAALKNHQSDASSDFTIISGESTFKVHRLVASMHSSYFKRLCDPASEFKESSERKVQLGEDSPLAVKLMVDYFYAFDYPEPMFCVSQVGDASNPRNSLEAHSHMFTLADKYDIPGRRELAFSKFGAATKPVFMGSDEFFQKLAADLLVALPHIYTKTPPKDLRIHHVMMAAWIVDDKKLLEYVDEDDLEEVFREEPSFAIDLINELAGIAIGEKSARSKDDEEIASMGKEFGKKVEIMAAKTGAGVKVASSSTPSE